MACDGRFGGFDERWLYDHKPGSKSVTPSKTNVSTPEKSWLEDAHSF